jgi:quinol monooxygenase YgiN
MICNSKRSLRAALAGVATVIVTLLFCAGANAQHEPGYMRIAHIRVRPEKLDSYKTALEEGIRTAVKKEAGVISLRAMYDKKNPSHITVFEIYKDVEAYRLHIETDHFKKYKTTVADMVLSLELTDVKPIVFADKKE